MLLYIISFLILLVSLLAYFKIADHFNIIDKPNERSSHSYVTIRGGGIIFPLAAILWYLFFGFQEPIIIGSLLAIATISFLDDAIVLSNKIRISVHFLTVSVLFWQLQVFGFPWYLVLITYIITIGWINAFNFMDGINGITGFYSLITLCTLFWLFEESVFIYGSNIKSLLILLLFSVIIFSFYNARKRAKAFAGDVGSVSMAFLISWFMLKLIIETGRPEYILFVSVYGIDSVATIIYRLKRKENIFQAHRTHLYQYLSNEYKMPHLYVSGIYAGFQLAINILTLFLISKESMNIWVFITLISFLSVLYLIIRYIASKNLIQVSH